MSNIVTKATLIGAAVVTALSEVLGAYWYLFAAFLILEVVDYITGTLKAKYANKENSNQGLRGIIKKLGYWVVIAIAFFVAYSFTAFGKIIGMDLGITFLMGWFTLCTFIINEIRSILENLVALDVNVPAWLVKGLEEASDKLDNAAGGKDEHED